MKRVIILIILMCLTSITLAQETSNRVITAENAAELQIAREMIGRGGDVSDVAYSPQGTVFASSGADGRIFLWDAITYEQLTVLRHYGIVTTIAFSPDGDMIAGAACIRIASSFCGIVRIILWDINTYEVVTALEGHSDYAAKIAFSPDGQLLASAACHQYNVDRCTAGEIILWDIATQEQIATLIEHTNRMVSLAFSPDGQLLASSSYDDTVRLWNVANQQQVAELAEHSSIVIGLAFSPDGQLLASGDYGGEIKLWDMTTYSDIATLVDDSAYGIEDLVFTADGQTLIANNRHSSPDIFFWDVATQQIIGTLTDNHADHTQSFALSPDGQWLITEHYDHISVWNLVKGDVAITLAPHAESTSDLIFTPDNQSLLISSQYLRPYFLDLTTQRTTEIGNDHSSAVAVSPDGQQAAFADFDHLILWDINQRQRTNRLQATQVGLRLIAFNPNGSSIASSGDANVYIWNRNSYQRFRLEHPTSVTDFSFSTDGMSLVTVDRDSVIRLWRISDRFQRAIIYPQSSTDNIDNVTLSPDGLRIVFDRCTRTSRYTCIDTEIVIWDIASEREIGIMHGHSVQVTRLVFSTDGSVLASSDVLGIVRLWDTETLQELTVLTDSYVDIQDLEFSPDGTMLAAGGRSGIIVWALP